MALFHITTAEAWHEAQRAGAYRAASLETEGFVHLSSEAQWPRTRERYFAGRTGLVLLVVDASKLRAEVRWEEAHGEAFPHLYGELNLDAVIEARALA